MADIGKYIKSLRLAKNYSQRKLGYLSNVSNATINRIENSLSMPDPDTLKKLAHPLGVSYTELLNVAGYLYLNEKKFIPSNIKLIREKNGMDYCELAQGIKTSTGYDISPKDLEDLEKGESSSINPLLVNAIAEYQGINPQFFFRENTPENLEYALRNFPYEDDIQNRPGLSYIKDDNLRLWVCDPSNIDYLKFAKKISDLGIDPQFILNEFISKIFKDKTVKRKKRDKNLIQ